MPPIMKDIVTNINGTVHWTSTRSPNTILPRIDAIRPTDVCRPNAVDLKGWECSKFSITRNESNVWLNSNNPFDPVRTTPFSAIFSVYNSNVSLTWMFFYPLESLSYIKTLQDQQSEELLISFSCLFTAVTTKLRRSCYKIRYIYFPYVKQREIRTIRRTAKFIKSIKDRRLSISRLSQQNRIYGNEDV